MQAKHNIPKGQKPEPTKQPAEVKKQRKPKPTLPDHPVETANLDNLPQITQREITGYLDALYRRRLALADFERRRADLSYKLAVGCRVDPNSDIKARLDENNRLILTEECGTCLSKFDPRSEMFW